MENPVEALKVLENPTVRAIFNKLGVPQDLYDAFLGITGHEAIFLNGDPRGYALKIKDDFIRDNKVNIYKDWGGYGIFAPDFAYFDQL